MVTLPVEIYSDGSALNNPGPAGLAFIIRYEEMIDDQNTITKEIEFNQGYRLSTNNRMEIMSALFGLQKSIDLVNDGTFSGVKQVSLFSDSDYVCRAINQKWIDKWVQNNWMTSGFKGSQPTPVKNQDLWEKIIEVRSQFQNKGIILTVTHVKGHADNELNNLCDTLAKQAANGSNKLVDEIYEASTNSRNRRNF